MNELTVYGTRGVLRNARKRLDSDGYLPARSSEVTFSSRLPLGHQQEMLVLMAHLAECILDGKDAVGGGARGRVRGGHRPGLLGVAAQREAGAGAQ